MTINLAGHNKYLQGTETVTREDGVTGATSSIDLAILLKIDNVEQEESLGVYQGYLSRLRSPVAISIGDYITSAAGMRYIVLEVRPPWLNDIWTATLLNLGFYRFNDTATHYGSIYTPNEYGSKITTYVIKTPPFACRLQPDGDTKEIIGFKNVMVDKYNLYCITNLSSSIYHGDIIVMANGYRYKVVGFTHKQSITDLMTLKLERNYEGNLP